MTFMSLAVYVPLSIWTLFTSGPPSLREVQLAAGVALSSGAVATVLFFGATELVRFDRLGLAAVEAMQAGELLFSALFGAIFLAEAWPHGISGYGATAVVSGIIIFSFLSSRSNVRTASCQEET